jgi:hypothetical protein
MVTLTDLDVSVGDSFAQMHFRVTSMSNRTPSKDRMETGLREAKAKGGQRTGSSLAQNSEYSRLRTRRQHSIFVLRVQVLDDPSTSIVLESTITT